jgi:ribonuclease J
MSKDDELIFLPLGGSGEIGMNMNLYAVGPAHKRQWIMVDCGVTFAGLQTPGIDLITPDPEYLLDDVERGGGKLHGLLLTHGHEDHIGAVATLWPYLKCPIYASAFTAGLVERKFAEADVIDPPINVIDMGARFNLGPFDLEYVTLTHSVPEPSGVIIRTDHGTLLHTGDWKIDKTPSLGPVTDNNKLVELSKEGVLAMICDSTNVLTAGESGSESVVQKNLIDLISRLEGKVAVTTFASNVGRLVSVCEAAKQNDRAVCLLGRSMLRMIEVAKETGILPSGYVFVEPDEAGYLPNNKVLYLCTGSQGEARAALGRIARDDHRDITLGQGDTVIFSSKIIPGNEREIFDLQNALVELGVDIITEKDEFIHVSGHPCRDELEQMYDWVKPQYAIPVHGEARHLEEHAKFAEAMGVDKAISPRNGDMIRLAPGEPAVIDEVPSGRLLLDGTILTPEGGPAIRDRRKIAYAGLIVVAVALDSKDNVLAPPEVSIAGLPPRDAKGEEFQVLLEDRIEDTVDALSRARRRDDGEIELAIKRSLRDFLKRRWGKRPNVRVLIIRG